MVLRGDGFVSDLLNACGVLAILGKDCGVGVVVAGDELAAFSVGGASLVGIGEASPVSGFLPKSEF